MLMIVNLTCILFAENLLSEAIDFFQLGLDYNVPGVLLRRENHEIIGNNDKPVKKRPKQIFGKFRIFLKTLPCLGLMKNKF